jgi:predicted methyltransferase
MSRTQEKTLTRSKYRVRLPLFLACALALLIGSYVAYRAFLTLTQLDAIEAVRDEWQRPAEVIEALGVKPGAAVVDLGCGSGYFSLKLSDPVGKDGKVIAEDIRRLSLAFLWMRIFRKSKQNITVLLGKVDNPHLRPQSVNAVLILNTYHEFTAAQRILEHVHESLIPGGRVVIVDRSPRGIQDQSANVQEHQVSSDQVEADLQRTDFQIDRQTNNFIESNPEHESWWLIVAHR